eukprot:TRINITY_DN4036_c0_g1_i1.p1 TRINITY_DN4036_c0_g1~~TRINITY_DN4036_c0_g1_i1.p1  ORF type:complete len:725 (+),score=233.54 TRINITY_DN4036_c0_g1_i1:65-2176(+)
MEAHRPPPAMGSTPHGEGNGRAYLQKFGLVDDSVTALNLFLEGMQAGQEGALDLAKGIAENWSLTSLELRRNEIGAAGAVPLAQALAVNTSLRYLGLGRNKLTNAGGVHIAEALKINRTLESIDLEWNELRDECATAFAEVLAASNSLLTVSLERNKIQKDGVAAIGAALAENRKLKTLNLGWNKARVVGAIALADALRENSSLKGLNLAMNQIPSEGAFAIANALRDNSCLESLNLQHNRIGDALIMLGDSLRHNTTLRELNCEGNYLTSACAQVFGRSLQHNRSIMSLNFARNEIGDAGISAIANALRSSNSLRYLDFGETGVTQEGMAAVCDLLDSCPNLQTLILEDNNLGAAGARCLAARLAARAYLTALNLNRTKIEPAGVKALGESLMPPTRHHLRSLQLAGLGAGYEPSLVLCNALSGCSSLITLDLSGNDIASTLREPLCRVLLANRDLSYIYLRDNDVAADTPNSALLRSTAEDLLTKQAEAAAASSTDQRADDSGFPPPPAAHVPSANFASRSVTAGAGPQVGPVDDLFRPSELSLLQPLRGTQAYAEAPAEAAASPDATAGSLESAQQAARRKLGGAPRRSPAAGAGRVAVVGRTLFSQRPSGRAGRGAGSHLGGLMLSDDQLRKEFNRLDRNGNGFLDADEFKTIYRSFENYGVEASERQVESVIRRHNMRGDKRISFQEYCIIMLSLVAR